MLILKVSRCEFFRSDEAILSCSWDNTMKIWGAEHGELLFTLEGHTAPISAFVVLDNGLRILSSSLDTTVRIWTKSELTGAYMHKILRRHQSAVYGCVAHDEENTFVTCCNDGQVIEWDWTDGRVLHQFGRVNNMLLDWTDI